MNRVLPNSSTRNSTYQASPVRLREQGAVVESEVQEPAALPNFERDKSIQASSDNEVPLGILYTSNQTQEEGADRISVHLEHDGRGRAAGLVPGQHSPLMRDLGSPSTAVVTADESSSGQSVQAYNIDSNKVLYSLVPRRSSRRLSIQNDEGEVVKTQECGLGHLTRRASERIPLETGNEKAMSGQSRPETEGDQCNQLQILDHIGLEEILADSAVLPTRSQASPVSEHGLDRSCQGRRIGFAEAVAKESQSSPTKHMLASTRSGTRFSDDTTMLRNFLSRAQARKAATAIIESTASLQPLGARRRSPRKVLGRLDNNSPCSTRSQTPSTPPDCSRLDVAEELDDNRNEARTSPPSRRRSSRKRFPASPKSCTTIPSFIPVRRADGVDAVKLQKSEAQELAIITRTNTRLNKGQSKFPRIRLETLGSSDPVTNAVAVPRKRSKGAKMVNWHDENLVRYYAQVHDLGQESELKRGKEADAGSGTRRVRNLGAGNGTPKSERLTRDPTLTHDTPRPRRRGKSRA